MQPSESDRAALQFIAEGVTELAGFGVAAIGVVRDGMLGDPLDLDAVVGNLASNAIKYSEPGGRVRVLVRRCTGRPEGVGTADDERDRVFEEFFRSADPRVRERAGTGLGLAIVERAVSRHGGRVDVESAPDVGTRFRVLLPLVG